MTPSFNPTEGSKQRKKYFHYWRKKEETRLKKIWWPFFKGPLLNGSHLLMSWKALVSAHVWVMLSTALSLTAKR